MPADRPGRGPGPAPDDPYYLSGGVWAQDLPEGGGPGRGPAPGPQEVYHLRDGEWAQLRSEARYSRGGPAPTRAERFYLEGGEGPPGRGSARTPRGRHAPTRVDGFSSGSERGPGDRGSASTPRGRHAPTRAERFSFQGGQGPGRPGGRSWEAEESDDGLYARQMAGIRALISISHIDSGLYDSQVAGIRALISIANEVTVATRSREIISPTGEIRKLSRLSVISKLRKDEMIWNSLFLVMNTGLMSGTGFLFWIITAHMFSVSDVGKGSALISGVSLIGGLALLGLNMGMGRYLPNARNRDALISSGLAMVAVVGALGAIIYILLTPFVAPGLAFLEKSPLLMVSFSLITAATAVNTLTDNIFIASRKAKYTTLVDGVIGGFGKIALTFVVAGAGAYGVFLASSLATALAAAASLLLIFIVMRVRIDLRQPLEVLKPLLRFSGANYASDVVSVVSGLVVPILLLDRLGANSAAYYFVGLQMAQIVYTAGAALEQTFLSEGSRADADMRQLRRRSLRMLVIFFVPSAGIMIGLGRWLLLAFGSPYYQNGYTTLVILVLAAAPISANLWFQTILRLANKLRALVVINITGSVVTCLGVWVGSSHGLTGVAWGWFVSNLIQACMAGIAARERNAGY